MSALAAALEAAGHLAPVPSPASFHRAPDRTDPQLTILYWNHACPAVGCMAWVPNHRRGCAGHNEETT